MLFIHTIGYISSGRARHARGWPVCTAPYARRGIARPGSNGFRITRQSEWTECIIACADIVRPAAQLCSWVSAFHLLFSSPSLFVFPRSRTRRTQRYLRYHIWRPSILGTARGKDDLECNKVHIYSLAEYISESRSHWRSNRCWTVSENAPVSSTRVSSHSVTTTMSERDS